MASTIDTRRARVREKITLLEGEFLRWERARVAAQTAEERAAAVEQLAHVRKRLVAACRQQERLRDQLTLPWFAGYGRPHDAP